MNSDEFGREPMTFGSSARGLNQQTHRKQVFDPQLSSVFLQYHCGPHLWGIQKLYKYHTDIHTKYLLDSLLWYLHLRHLGTGAWRGARAGGVGWCHVGGRNSTWFRAPFKYAPCESIPYIPWTKMHAFPACTGSNGSKVWPGAGATTNSWTGGLRRHQHWHPQHSKQLGILWCRCF